MSNAFPTSSPIQFIVGLALCLIVGLSCPSHARSIPSSMVISLEANANDRVLWETGVSFIQTLLQIHQTPLDVYAVQTSLSGEGFMFKFSTEDENAENDIMLKQLMDHTVIGDTVATSDFAFNFASQFDQPLVVLFFLGQRLGETAFSISDEVMNDLNHLVAIIPTEDGRSSFPEYNFDWIETLPSPTSHNLIRCSLFN
eukprot:m.11553 g.11553  ORF g.11553 m.11553 type:complete len:199 (-) comp6975_c0_seq1:154-750(-)